MTDEVPYGPNEASTAQPGHGIGAAPLPEGNASGLPTAETLDLPASMRDDLRVDEATRKGSAAGTSIDFKIAALAGGDSKKSAYIVDADEEDADSEDETVGSEPEVYTTQGRMKDLKSSEANIAPGLKREKWW